MKKTGSTAKAAPKGVPAITSFFGRGPPATPPTKPVPRTAASFVSPSQPSPAAAAAPAAAAPAAVAVTPTKLTDEQRRRMEENKAKALAKRGLSGAISSPAAAALASSSQPVAKPAASPASPSDQVLPRATSIPVAPHARRAAAAILASTPPASPPAERAASAAATAEAIANNGLADLIASEVKEAAPAAAAAPVPEDEGFASPPADGTKKRRRITIPEDEETPAAPAEAASASPVKRVKSEPGTKPAAAAAKSGLSFASISKVKTEKKSSPVEDDDDMSISDLVQKEQVTAVANAYAVQPKTGSFTSPPTQSLLAAAKKTPSPAAATAAPAKKPAAKPSIFAMFKASSSGAAAAAASSSAPAASPFKSTSTPKAAPAKSSPLSRNVSSPAALKKQSAMMEDDFGSDADDDDDGGGKKKGGGAGKGGASHGGDREANIDYAFLQADKIMDKKKRRPDHPEYDARTLYVPPAVLASMSPGQKQYWEIKSDNNDVVLFFKMGKFYELFDSDAELGVKELGLAYMKAQSRPHCGFPEAAFLKYAEQLVALGYKVGRVEQMETPAEMKARNASAGKGGKDKVVKREMCSILTKGTIVDPSIIHTPDASYLLSLCENAASSDFGLCFVDTSTGQFHVGSFSDDRQRTRLRTLLAQIRPVEFIFPRDGLSAATNIVLRNELRSNVLKTGLTNNSEFWDAETTISQLNQSGYFNVRSTAAKSDEKGAGEWPPALLALQENGQSIALSALGGCVSYLRRLLLDNDLLPMKRFSLYDPSEVTNTQFLILDGQTLSNLEVMDSADGDAKGKGTLLAHVDHTVTGFGRRLLRLWVSRPLARIADIDRRLDAVEDFMQNPELAQGVTAALKGLPDLERLLSRIHVDGLSKVSEAVMYTNVNAAKLNNFVKALSGFEATAKVLSAFAGIDLKSERLKHLSTVGAGFPNVNAELKFFATAFDRKAAIEAGMIVPRAGVDEEYDSANAAISENERSLDAILKQVKTQLNDKTIKFVHKVKEKYQLEISATTIARGHLPDDFELCGATKKSSRYTTPELKTAVAEYEKAVETKETLSLEITRRMFSRFCQSYEKWTALVACLAELDCLCSLATTSQSATATCRPKLVPLSSAPKGQPFLELRGCTHPALATVDNTKQFIPNDTLLGAGENPARFVLLSGPNMGGKSTLLRQTCNAVIMAQLGCYVPAESCTLTPIDRIFTRVGANDRIMQGQSTFLVELEETANILRHATSRSLVILDELGRGTSTFDGTAIAFAVTNYLCTKIGCLTLFSTHYHMLSELLATDPNISMYHMACAVKPEVKPGAVPEVTFLYKLTRGICPKSFGMNVAKLAGLPASLVERAGAMSERFESRLDSVHIQPQVKRNASESKDQAAAAEKRYAIARKIHSALSEPKVDAGLFESLQSQTKSLLSPNGL